MKRRLSNVKCNECKMKSFTRTTHFPNIMFVFLPTFRMLSKFRTLLRSDMAMRKRKSHNHRCHKNFLDIKPIFLLAERKLAPYRTTQTLYTIFYQTPYTMPPRSPKAYHQAGSIFNRFTRQGVSKDNLILVHHRWMLWLPPRILSEFACCDFECLDAFAAASFCRTTSANFASIECRVLVSVSTSS